MFLLRFLAGLLFDPNIICHLRQLYCFQPRLWAKDFSQWVKPQVNLNKDNFVSESPKNQIMIGSNNNNHLGRGLWRGSSPILPPPCGCQAADFHCPCGLLIIKATVELGGKHGKLNLTQPAALSEIQPCFLNKFFSVCHKSLINFRVLKSWFWQFFARVLIAL